MQPIYPTRSFIRFQSKSQLVADLTGQQVMTFVNRSGETSYPEMLRPSANSELESQPLSRPAKSNLNEPESEGAANESLMSEPLMSEPLMGEPLIDEALLEEITATVFRPDQHPELYQPCNSRQEATQIEHEVAAEIIAIYKRILQNQRDAMIQRLNALL